uniref:Uncharacterized protein n=1 Tax=Oryza rufipogon TaxID=4529 RepID=A0A0E0P6C8_ORYRU
MDSDVTADMDSDVATNVDNDVAANSDVAANVDNDVAAYMKQPDHFKTAQYPCKSNANNRKFHLCIRSMQIMSLRDAAQLATPGAQAQHKNNKSKGQRIGQLNHQHLESEQKLNQEHLASDQQLQVGGENSGCSPPVHAIL